MQIERRKTQQYEYGRGQDDTEEQEGPTELPIGDLPGAVISEADRKLLDVYGNYIHQNDGSHLDGGIADDAEWQDRCRKLVVLPAQRCQAPGGPVGRRFVRMLAAELEGVTSRKWNSERFIVFQMVILQRVKGVTKAGDIKRRLSTRMDSWEEQKFDMLVQDTERTALPQLAKSRGGSTPEQRAKTYNRLILQGKLRAAVRGVLLPGETDEKTGETIFDVLKSKHPAARVPEASEMEDYDILPDFVDVDITEDIVEQVARRLSGSAGPGGSDAQAIQQWLLRFGGASQELRRAVAKFVSWMANDSPPWAAYRSCRVYTSPSPRDS